MHTTQTLDHMNPQALRELVLGLMLENEAHKQDIAKTRMEIDQHKKELVYRQTKIDQLTHEIALAKRWKFGQQSERLGPVQASLLEETLDADIAAMTTEIEALQTPEPVERVRQQPKRSVLPASLPRVEFRHEPDSTHCGCGCQLKRIGEDVSEKLDYTPGVMTVERHIRGKWVCNDCKTMTQGPVPAQIIDKGIATSGLLVSLMDQCGFVWVSCREPLVCRS